jgi:hypothetical protein
MPRDDISLEELAAALPEYATPEVEKARSPLEERVLAGFEEVQRWVSEHGRAPRHGEGLDIFERLYAVRLDRIREYAELRTIVEELDHQGLLAGGEISIDPAAISDEELAAELAGIGEVKSDITTLKHVRSWEEIEAAEDIASRKPCEDFEQFRSLFTTVQEEIKAGFRETRRFGRDAAVLPGDFFILGGQFAYVAAMNEGYRTPNGELNARLRVIFDNGTESDLLLRSLQRALYKDAGGRRVTKPDAGPLFRKQADADF